jgi:hypothetical protein
VWVRRKSNQALIKDHRFLCNLTNLFRQSAVYAEMTGPRLPVSAFGGKADMPSCTAHVRF